MFGALLDMANNMKRLNANLITNIAISDPYIQAQIIDLNQSQLYDKGIESDGSPTGDYSRKSVEVYGKRPGHITLKDTGATYDSMKVDTDAEGFYVSGDMDLHGVDLNIIYPNALGLTEDSKRELLPEIKELMIEQILKSI